MTLQRTILAALLTLMVGHGSASCASLGDWPQWRGPQRDDLSNEQGLLTQWPEEGPPRLWMFEDCGVGYSGPAIVGNSLYLMGARNGQTEMICLDVTSGAELWSVALSNEYNNDWGNGPRGTPTIDDDRVYGITGNGTLFPSSGPLSPTDVTDNPGQTILVTEAAPIVSSGSWSEPIDLDFALMQGRVGGTEGFEPGGVLDEGVAIVTIDGRGHFLPSTVEPITFRALVTPQGGEPLADDTLD